MNPHIPTPINQHNQPQRLGAMDAFRLPSVQNGRAVPRKAPVAQCVGVLKDPTSLARG